LPRNTNTADYAELEGEVMKSIIDVCCGSKMFWFDRENENTVFMDIREFEGTLCDGRKLVIKPDIVGDFRNIPFPDNTFKLAVFDPPHLIRVGESSWMAKKYGKLNENWKDDIRQGFNECMRVLKPNGVLIFKWNEEQIKIGEVLAAIDYKPLFGDRRAKTRWLVFMKLR
jgi:ubiquinone/menaquinone biosynthesis C-methylase UbiE